MTQPLRLSSAASLIVIGSMIAGCAAHQARLGSATHSNGSVDPDTAYASRALAALESNNLPSAIDLAEKAVAKTPSDAAFRTLLGNIYFAAGRFHSAEQAYGDSLTLNPDQPKAVLKLALVEIAQGKNRQALTLLNDSRGALDASDYGLALALAGQSNEAIAVLEPAARDRNADSTVRQNLALAHALAGDWAEARTIAAQDVPGNLLDARIHQWMQLANHTHPADQVAALIGVTPALMDAGQPVQLALNKGETTPAVAPAEQRVAQASPLPAPAAAAKPAFVEAAQPAAPPPFIAVAPAPASPRPTLAAMANSVVTEAKSAFAAMLPHAAAAAPKPRMRMAAAGRPVTHAGKSTAVVQLGAYGSPERVLAAWNGEARKFGGLKSYSPMSARFASPKGTFYRLSVRGFDNVGQAIALCNSLRHQGGACFVRNVAGDAPVNIASR